MWICLLKSTHIHCIILTEKIFGGIIFHLTVGVYLSHNNNIFGFSSSFFLKGSEWTFSVFQESTLTSRLYFFCDLCVHFYLNSSVHHVSACINNKTLEWIVKPRCPASWVIVLITSMDSFLLKDYWSTLHKAEWWQQDKYPSVVLQNERSWFKFLL